MKSSRSLLSVWLTFAVLNLYLASAIGQQNTPGSQLEFEMSFYPTAPLIGAGAGDLVSRHYGTNGPVEPGRLLPGMRVVAGLGGRTHFGTHWHEVYQIDAASRAPQKMTLGSGVPELSWPMGVAFDSRRNRLLLVSLGGEGFLYAYSGLGWSTVASMENHDFDSIVYHPELDLIFAMGHDGHLHKLNAEGRIVGQINLPALNLHIGPGGYQTELAWSGRYLALFIEPDGLEMQAGQESRIYLIDVQTGTAQLTYRKVWPSTPPNQLPTVQWVQPSAGAVFALGTSIPLQAQAQDRDGQIRSVQFMANNIAIGAGTPNSIPATGRYGLVWTPAAAGPYVLTARVTDDAGAAATSAGVTITIPFPQPDHPEVSISTLDAEATEGAFDDVALFEVSRAGDLTRELMVFFSIHGTARNGSDYAEIQNYVRIPAGQRAASIRISPRVDALTVVEPMETVGIRIEPQQLNSGLPYEINPNRREAAAVIYERQPPLGGALELAIPVTGARYGQGELITFMAAAYLPGTPISHVDFYNGEVKIGSSAIVAPGQIFTIEAEDFDFGGGNHEPVADSMPYFGGAYQTRDGVHGIDYGRDLEVSEGDAYRIGESPNAPMTPALEPSGKTRGDWEVEVNYRIGWITGGTWFNYTRNFPPGQYRVYAGLTHGTTDEGTLRGTLAKVIAGGGTPSQTLQPLGSFSGRGSGGWTTVNRVPLINNGQAVMVDLGGPTTLRFTGASGDYDYLLFEGASASPRRLVFPSFGWSNAPAGTHNLTARAVLPNGQQLVSSSVRITVEAVQPAVVGIRFVPHETTEPWPNEDFAPGSLEVSRTGSTAAPLLVFFQTGGTATPDLDYERLVPASILIPAGQTAARLKVIAKDDLIDESSETVVVTLIPPLPTVDPAYPANYSIDPARRSAEVIILDNDDSAIVPTVAVFTRDSEATEFSPAVDAFDSARFVVHRSGELRQNQTVFFSIHGTAKNGEDYRTIPTTVTIPAGRESVEIEIVPLADASVNSHHYEVVINDGISWASANAKAEQSTYGGVRGHLATVSSGEEDAQIEALRQAASPPGYGSLWLGGFQQPAQPSPSAGWIWLNDEGPIPTSGASLGYSNWQPSEPNDYWGPQSENYLSTGHFNVPGWNDDGGINSHVGGYVVEYDTAGESALEKMETVGIRLELPATMSILPGYQIDARQRHAGAVIYERTAPAAGVLEIVIPSSGAKYPGESVVFMAAGFHPSQDILKVDFFVDGFLVGTSEIVFDKTTTGGLVFHSVQWAFPTIGHHVLQAKTLLLNGQTLVSPQIPFVVEGEGGNLPPRVTILKPVDGTALVEGNSVEITVEASDPDGGSIQRIELLADDRLLQAAESSSLRFTWSNLVAGQHTLVARAVDNLGATGTSAVVRILVRNLDAVAFVQRVIPAAYSAGVPFLVELKATPLDVTRAYAVEDRPPAGWLVSQISHDGVFDAATGKVKFGVYTDAQPRTLSYWIKPPATASGRHEFSGSSSANGSIYPIGGGRSLDAVNRFHPADRDQNNQMGLAELTAYAAAWKSGDSWNSGPVPIPLSYVTRAALLWKRGETYRFEALAGAPPLCWVSLADPVPVRQSLSAVTSERRAGAMIAPGSTTEVQLMISPRTDAGSFAVEEKIPAGWAVSGLSHDGVYDPQTGTIRWGLFLDNNARTFRYSLTAPADVAAIANLAGHVSFDGETMDIVGSTRVVAGGVSTSVALQARRDSAATGRLLLSGAPGQFGVLETSFDLVDWTEVNALFLPDGTAEVAEPMDAQEKARFYRFRVE